MIKIVLLGPPGSGKGTQSELICKKFAIRHISTGELLRQAILQNTLLGMEVKKSIETGHLVADHLIMDLVNNTIKEKKISNGFLLDGFPRTLLQAKLLQESGTSIDFVFYLRISDEIIIERLSGRRYHPNSGRIYHVKYNPPKISGIDDITKEPLMIREDDQEQIIRNRLSIYHKITEETILWYKNERQVKFFEIDGSLPQNSVFSKISKFIETKITII